MSCLISRCFVGDAFEMTVEDCLARDRANPEKDPRETRYNHLKLQTTFFLSFTIYQSHSTIDEVWCLNYSNFSTFFVAAAPWARWRSGCAWRWRSPTAKLQGTACGSTPAATSSGCATPTTRTGPRACAPQSCATSAQRHIFQSGLGLELLLFWY